MSRYRNKFTLHLAAREIRMSTERERRVINLIVSDVALMHDEIGGGRGGENSNK